MTDEMPDSPLEGEPSLGETFGQLAEQGLSHASDGFAETMRGQPIGSPDSPEAAFTAKRPVHTMVAQVGREGLDPLMGKGFEDQTHRMAAEQYLNERNGRTRERDQEDLARG